MSWSTDKSPIEYLRQRIRYYEKKRSMVKNFIKKPEMVKRYGDELPYIIARRLLSIASYIEQYKRAVRNLQDIESEENKLQ